MPFTAKRIRSNINCIEAQRLPPLQHFLELVEHGYYDGLCVHDYNSSSEKLYTGGYTYDANQTADGGLVEKNYFDIVKDWNMTQTVWDINDKDPVYTLYGEFSDNGFSVENGALKQSYGSLTMYYTPKEKCATYVDVKRSDGKGNDAKLYKYNSATSLFYISLSSSSSGSGTSYCTFATLEDDSVEVLDDLKAAITDYIEDEYEGNAADFAPTSKVVVDRGRPLCRLRQGIPGIFGSPRTHRHQVRQSQELLILFRTRRFALDDKIKKDRFPRERGNGLLSLLSQAALT